MHASAPTTRAAALVALVRQETPALPAPSPERMAAIETLDARIEAQWGEGLDQEQAAVFFDDDVAQIEAALDDWEARLGIQVDDIAAALGARSERAPGP